MPRLVAIVVMLVTLESSYADDTIDEIFVTSTRMQSSIDDVARSLSVVSKEELQNGRQLLGMSDALARVPGLYIQNQYNFSQDLRISIRGFGARSSFGVRGIRIFVDGIPESLPDGQSQLDGIDLGTAEKIEVLRGPSSSLYGNAAGGVIAISSELGTSETYLEGSVAGGSYDFHRYQLKAIGSSKSIDYLISASRTELGGYRDNSEFVGTSFNAKLSYQMSPQDGFLFALNVTDQPTAQDAGGITELQVASNRRSARAQNVIYDAGEKLQQLRVGGVYKTDRLGGDLTIRNYYAWRDFSNRLPFTNGGAVDLQRFYYGLGLQFASTDASTAKFQFVTGLDLDRQDDDRTRFDNNAGVAGAKVFDQNETVNSNGVFMLANFKPAESWAFSAGLRFDDVSFEVRDRFGVDGDDSGTTSFQHWSPSLSASLASNLGMWFATFSTSFETPTTTELANPDGTGGFNQSLRPQTAENYEVGIKATVGLTNIAVSAFHIDLSDELIPFEIGSSPGRTFYSNAGSSTRNGLEAELSWEVNKVLAMTLSLTWSDFIFDHFELDSEEFGGNHLPGLPEYFGFLSLAYKPYNDTELNFEMQYSGELFATNDNYVEVGSHVISNLRVLHLWEKGRWVTQLHCGINNIFDEAYNDNIRINAFGGRYYEPAPERNFYAGIRVQFGD